MIMLVRLLVIFLMLYGQVVQASFSKTISLVGLEELFANLPEKPLDVPSPRVSAEVLAELIDTFTSNSVYNNNDEPVESATSSSDGDDEDNIIVGYAEAVCAEPGEVVYAVGDIHGSLHSLLRQLRRWCEHGVIDEQLKVARGTKIFFVGDYVDRIPYGTECLAILLLFKLRNPQAVFLLRGNHELVEVNQREGGFIPELQKKYQDDPQAIITKLNELYQCFSLTCYFLCGTTCIQFVHGFHDPGFSPQELYKRAVKNGYAMEYVAAEEVHKKTVLYSHFLWTDVVEMSQERYEILRKKVAPVERDAAIVQSCDKNLFLQSPRGPNCSAIDRFGVQLLCKKNGVTAVVRGHQDIGAVLKLLRNNLSTTLSLDAQQELAPWQEVLGTKPCFPMNTVMPIFTLSTATARTGGREGCVKITTAIAYADWMMEVQEHQAPPLLDAMVSQQVPRVQSKPRPKRTNLIDRIKGENPQAIKPSAEGWEVVEKPLSAPDVLDRGPGVREEGEWLYVSA